MDKLKERRQEMGLSQTEIANKLGVHVNTYRLWEQGAGKPNAENRKRIEDVLDVKLDQSV